MIQGFKRSIRDIELRRPWFIYLNACIWLCISLYVYMAEIVQQELPGLAITGEYFLLAPILLIVVGIAYFSVLVYLILTGKWSKQIARHGLFASLLASIFFGLHFLILGPWMIIGLSLVPSYWFMFLFPSVALFWSATSSYRQSEFFPFRKQ